MSAESNHKIFVEDFGRAMVARLNEDPEFVNGTPTVSELCVAMRICSDELRTAARNGERHEVRELTADLANLTMRFNQLYGT